MNLILIRFILLATLAWQHSKVICPNSFSSDYTIQTIVVMRVFPPDAEYPAKPIAEIFCDGRVEIAPNVDPREVIRIIGEGWIQTTRQQFESSDRNLKECLAVAERTSSALNKCTNSLNKCATDFSKAIRDIERNLKGGKR